MSRPNSSFAIREMARKTKTLLKSQLKEIPMALSMLTISLHRSSVFIIRTNHCCLWCHDDDNDDYNTYIVLPYHSSMIMTVRW